MQHAPASSRRLGFTLLEITVFLIISGLIVGGVLVGQSMIKSAQLQATIKQMTDIRQATVVFKDKYGGLPGDLSNAKTFWPSTASGNGNGKIETTSGTCTPTDDDADCGAFNGERATYFEQLSLSGFIPETYKSNSLLQGTGYPAVKLHPSSGMFITGPFGPAGGSNIPNYPSYVTGPLYLSVTVVYPNYVSGNSNNSSFNDGAIFTAEEVYDIDKKIDDGMPLSGKIIAHSFNTICLSGSNYALNSSDLRCNLMYDLR